MSHPVRAFQRVTVAFRAPYGDRGSLTWGQTAIWEVLRWLPPGDASLNLLAVCEVEPGRDVGDVLAAVRALVERHDALHTLFPMDDQDGGRPVQVVLRSGELEVAVHETGTRNPGTVAAYAGARLRDLPFDIGGELPLRVAVVTTGGVPVRVVLVVSHMAVDGWSLKIVRDDLRTLLSVPAALGPVAEQPLGRLAYERSERARLRERRAFGYWAEAVRELPRVWLEDLRQGGEARQDWSEIRSRALSRAVRELAARASVTPGMVLQATVALLLGLYKGEEDVALRLIVSTRFKPETRRFVGAFNQNALLRLRLRHESFSGFLSHAGRAALAAYSTCEYDPVRLEELVARVTGERGIGTDGYCFYNDIRFDAPAPPAGHRLSPAEYDALMGETELVEPPHDTDQKGATFFLYVHELSERAVLTLCADRRFLAPRGPADFLSDLEWLAVEALRTDAGPLRLAEALARRQRGDGAEVTVLR
ncbi:condensation domain-containing protein [Streptosporangium sp. NPDC002524]|uniref:condensation domain-containing protein n=1 Tax=Streptosporangium sp. NPDC002524 TaxID=3154537 RepID=UPI00331BD539